MGVGRRWCIPTFVGMLALIGFSLLLPHSSPGAWQTLSGYPGWEVDYNFRYNGYTTDLYRYNGVNRFWYNQGPGQWFDRSAVSGAWSVLGPAGQSRTFMGDHNWHTFTDNKSFQLHTNNEWGVWTDNGVYRFLYDYTRGQWCDRSAVNGAWSCLGPDNQISAFIGDHKWHTFTDNRSYQYYTNNQWGVWLENGQYRFLYDYAAGQWKDRSVGNGTWSNLGPSNQLSAYIGDHLWHSFGNGLTYRFFDNNAWGTWQQDGNYRFLYDYMTGQWKHRSTPDGTWYALGDSGQLGSWVDGANWHRLDNNWSYQYSGGYGLWYNASLSLAQFKYDYGAGQWYHGGKNGSWAALGSKGTPLVFMGDGSSHRIWSDGATYQYSSGFGFLSQSGRIPSDYDFFIDYANSRWYMGLYPTTYDLVEYSGQGRYLFTNYIYWTAAGLKSTTPTGSNFGTDVKYTLWSTNRFLEDQQLAVWYIFTPGTDRRWSGGKLNVAVLDSSDVLFLGQEQYANEDVITVECNLHDTNGTGLYLQNVLNTLGYIKDTYGKTIDNLYVTSHGNTTGFWFGDWISTDTYHNYTQYASQWSIINGLMTDGGELQFDDCLVGAASSMLDYIAVRTTTRVFSNINSVWCHYDKLNSSYSLGDPTVWNYNVTSFYEGFTARPAGGDKFQPTVNFIDLDLEYQSDRSGKRAYTPLFNFYNPGYSQADMVYWWNNGNGRP